MLGARWVAAGAQISSTGSIVAGSRLFRTAHSPGLGDVGAVAELCGLGSSIPTLQIIQRPESCSAWDRNESSAAAYPANGDCHAHGRHHLGNSCFAGSVGDGRLLCLRRSYGPCGPMPSDNYIALVVCGLAVALVDVALMACYSMTSSAG